MSTGGSGNTANNNANAMGGYNNMALGNNLGHHQTMFFGPAHTLTQYSSLPRRSAMSNAFQRNTPIRRSTGIPEHHMEYFVPRSISEFNLSGVGDLALPPPRRYSPTMQHPGGGGLPHGLQLGPAQTLLCAPPPAPTAQLQIVMKPREKMVTFEDESKPMTAAMAMTANTQGTATHCPHGVPTTPRKATTLLGGSSSNNGNGNGAGGGGSSADVFM